ncbi:MAG: MBL fold metallo-hydrolase, partial [Promethearchaeota archaeon]
FLGFIFDCGGVRIYHSGDCIPYPGLTKRLKELDIDVALLPINGRDEYRLRNNILGNFLISEVLDICKSAQIKTLIVHHFGMFAFNTVPNDKLDDLRTASTSRLQIFIPDVNTIYKVKKK